MGGGLREEKLTKKIRLFSVSPGSLNIESFKEISVNANRKFYCQLNSCCSLSDAINH